MSRGVGVPESVGVCVFVLGPGHGFLLPTWIFFEPIPDSTFHLRVLKEHFFPKPLPAATRAPGFVG